MGTGKLQIQRFRTNDLVDNGGKQFELGKSWCEDFFEIPTNVSEYVINLKFIPLCKEHLALKDKIIELKLADVSNRGDRKAYINGEGGRSQIKDFFIDDLHLSVENNLSDYFAVYKTGLSFYYLYYVPEILYKNFISLFESTPPQINSKNDEQKATSSEKTRQIIYYGAPGTGKSNRIDEQTNENNRIRTTFHPDSDYSTFVGAYKPTMSHTLLRDLSGHRVKDEKTGNELWEKKIEYEFVPQAFLKAYVEAWKRKADGNDEPFYLVIEEINRGNCAQIFGDLFQLLDRDDEGQSRYGICPDEDIIDYLKEQFAAIDIQDEDIKGGKTMRLPSNLYIWATMNTSDQSLFPIDSAFKRRWDWEYMPIEDAGKGHIIEIGDKHYDWWDFVSTINEKIGKITSSEDKKLGYWFVKPADGETIINSKQFVGKVLFYLWNDVYKDYAESSESIFKTLDENGKEIPAPFTSFFGADSKKRLKSFMEINGIKPIDENEQMYESDEEESDDSSTEIQEWRYDFWTDLKTQYKQEGLDFRTAPPRRYCYQMALGAIGLSLMNWLNKSQNKCSVGIYIEAKQGDDYYAKLVSIKDVIDNEIGETLSWTHEDGRYASAKLLRYFNLDDSAKREEAIRWMAAKGKIIYDAFKTHLDVLR